jgi:hypothetical protein
MLSIAVTSAPAFTVMPSLLAMPFDHLAARAHRREDQTGVAGIGDGVRGDDGADAGQRHTPVAAAVAGWLSMMFTSVAGVHAPQDLDALPLIVLPRSARKQLAPPADDVAAAIVLVIVRFEPRPGPGTSAGPAGRRHWRNAETGRSMVRPSITTPCGGCRRRCRRSAP